MNKKILLINQDGDCLKDILEERIPKWEIDLIAEEKDDERTYELKKRMLSNYRFVIIDASENILEIKKNSISSSKTFGITDYIKKANKNLVIIGMSVEGQYLSDKRSQLDYDKQIAMPLKGAFKYAGEEIKKIIDEYKK